MNLTDVSGPITMTAEVRDDASISMQKTDETRTALRELGLGEALKAG